VPGPQCVAAATISLLPDRITLHLEPLRESVSCPDCSARSTRIHSRYTRRPWDLPSSCWPVQLVVHARKFFCDNTQCWRRIFTKPFPGVLARYIRQTQRLCRALLELAFSCGAEAASRVGRLLGYLINPDTLIQQQRQKQISIPTHRALGVDKFALRRGCTYGTILIDLERCKPVDILDGKRSEP
jgi:transposase